MNTVRHRTIAASLIVAAGFFAFLAFPPNCASQTDPSVWLAASGKVDITPEAPMWMAGYAARTKPAEGSLTPLFAKVLVLQDAATGKPAVLITLDLVGIDRELTGEIAGQLMQAFKIDRSRIAICTSHTHSGPALWRNLAPLHYLLMDDEHKERIRAYTESLVPRIVTVAKTVHASMHPARLSWGNGSSDFAVNRRENSEASVPVRRRDGTIVGPAQHDIPVLAVHDLDGTLQTIVFGYACHSTVLDQYQWCGDYPGFAQQALEIGHPQAVAMFWAGCGADQNPVPRRSVELAKHYGARLATAVDKVLLTTALQPLDAALHTRFDEIPLAYANIPTKEQLQTDTASDNRYTAARATMLLQQLDRDGTLPASYPFPIGHWSLGSGDSIDFLFLGGETVIDYAIRLKKELHGTRTWVASYSNDVMAYIPSERVLTEGGYEGGAATVYYGLPAPWAPGLEEKIITTATKSIKPSPR
ncbi:MAG: neutral ceramidase [Verrucomicrobiales bacterium]|jgi:neutral ceramidase